VESEEEDEEPVPSKKHKKEKEGAKQRRDKGEEARRRKGKKETSEDEAPLEEPLSDGPAEALLDPEDRKQKTGKWEVKLQGIRDLVQDQRSRKERLKGPAPRPRDDAPHSDSSDSSTLLKKAKSASSTSSTSSGTKLKEEEEALGPREAAAPGSTNLFEKFLLNCEAKDRAPRRQPAHQTGPEKTSKNPKVRDPVTCVTT